MKDLPYAQSSPHNLRAYRRARTIAYDIFWITRRIRCGKAASLCPHVRELAAEIGEGIADGWRQRADAPGAARCLDRVMRLSGQMAHWLNVIHALGFTSASEHARLMRQTSGLRLLLLDLKCRILRVSALPVC